MYVIDCVWIFFNIRTRTQGGFRFITKWNFLSVRWIRDPLVNLPSYIDVIPRARTRLCEVKNVIYSLDGQPQNHTMLRIKPRGKRQVTGAEKGLVQRLQVIFHYHPFSPLIHNMSPFSNANDQYLHTTHWLTYWSRAFAGPPNGKYLCSSFL